MKDFFSKSDVEELEKAAREILQIPSLPDSANGPRGKAILAQIQEDEKKIGKEAALRKWAHFSTVAYACALDEDPVEYKKASKVNIKDLENPVEKGKYHFPNSSCLQEALANPEKRKNCSNQTLMVLEATTNSRNNRK